MSSVGDEYLFPQTKEFTSASSNPAFLQLVSTITRKQVDDFLPVRCPDTEVSKRMADKIVEYRDRQDSIGGNVTCVIRNCPVGLGEPCFDKLEAELAHAMLSIPSTKGFEIGSGFDGCEMAGSAHNDAFVAAELEKPSKSGRTELKMRTNHSGGVQGGITNGKILRY